MSSKDKRRFEAPSASSSQALTELTTHVTDLLQRAALDPRFVRKLLKRLANEAQIVGDTTHAQTLYAALERLEQAVNGVQAGELVAAVAALRIDQDASNEGDMTGGDPRT